MFFNSVFEMNFNLARIVERVVLPIVTVIYFAEALRLTPWGSEERISVSFFPIVLSIVMFFALACMYWQRRRGNPTDVQSSLQISNPLKIAGITAVYILLFKPLGYVISTTFYIYGLFFIFQYAQERPWIGIVVAVLIMAVFYLFFSVGFQVRLPKLLGII